jgi:hypothetical protein
VDVATATSFLTGDASKFRILKEMTADIAMRNRAKHIHGRESLNFEQYLDQSIWP